MSAYTKFTRQLLTAYRLIFVLSNAFAVNFKDRVIHTEYTLVAFR